MLNKISDPNWFTLSWFGQTLDHVCRARGLVYIRPGSVGVCDRIPGVESGHVVAVSRELTETPRPIGVVVGGPCIGDCLAFPTLEALFDSVQLLLAARSFGAPALVYLGDREEALYRGGGSKRWTRLADRFAIWIRDLAAVLDVAAVTTVNTSSDAHFRYIAAASRPTRGIAVEDLDRAFHLGHGVVATGEESGRRSTCLVIEAHLVSVISRHVEVARGSSVLVTENLQQAGAFTIARELEPVPESLYFAGHLPAPSLSGSSRMYRANSWDKLPAWDLVAVAEGRSPGAHPYVQEFFGCWLDPELRARIAATARSAWAD